MSAPRAARTVGRPRRRRMVALTLALGISTVTAACSDSGISNSEGGFVSVEGAIKVLAPSQRQAPIGNVAGDTIDGGTADLADYAGKVVVLPVWGSWCGPCRKEAPMFNRVAKEVKSQGVEFLGLNVRDTSVANAAAFARNNDLAYPSLYQPSGALLRNFRSGLGAQSIPSVLFVDARGRVAAAISGEITESTLTAVIEEVRG